MHKTRLVLIIILFINLNIFSQAEQQVIISDTINDLSTTNDVVDLFSISLSDDELNDDDFSCSKNRNYVIRIQLMIIVHMIWLSTWPLET